MTRKGHVFTPPTAKEWKAAVRRAWEIQTQHPFTGPVELYAYFVLPRPAGHWRKKGGLTASAPLHHTARPDVDNLHKAVMDALGDAGAYHNDSMVVKITVTKAYQESPMSLPGCSIVLLQRD